MPIKDANVGDRIGGKDRNINFSARLYDKYFLWDCL